MKKIKVVVLGCGDRGNVYASYAKRYPEEMEVVAVVDVDEVSLKVTGDKYDLPETMRFSDIDDFLKAKVECDAVINATMDPAHYETTKKLIAAGYNQLLEKPIVNREDELLDLQERAKGKGVSIVVCHVLRYTPFYRSVKEIINSGEIGEILTLEINEHVGIIHFADSFVRGKWSDERVCGSGLLLQKCCHDMDLMCWLNNASIPSAVGSFASRSYFNEEHKPNGATEFCYQCPHNSTCLYSAQKIHLEMDTMSFQTWRGINKPLSEITKEEKSEFLKKDDYGKCVFTLKRQLADKQTVSVRFENGSLGTLTVVGGCSVPGRHLHIVGSKGEIVGRLEDNKFTVYTTIHEGEEYKTVSRIVDVSAEIGKDARHSNGDMCLMHDWVRFLNGNTDSISLTPIGDSINGHRCVYGAEKSRMQNEVVLILQKAT